MAGNGLIQILRGTTSSLKGSREILLDGQILYDKTAKKLYVGDGTTDIQTITGGG